MQTYQTRRNSDGHMLYFDAKELIDLCLDHNILYGQKNDHVFIYHQASSTDPKRYPEGWYKDDYEETIQDLMRDDIGIKTLLNALDKQNITFEPTLDIRLLDQFTHMAQTLQQSHTDVSTQSP